jgi:hypothetical protein
VFAERFRQWVSKHVLQGLLDRLRKVSADATTHSLGLPPLVPEDGHWEGLVPPDEDRLTRIRMHMAAMARRLDEARAAAPVNNPAMHSQLAAQRGQVDACLQVRNHLERSAVQSAGTALRRELAFPAQHTRAF